MIKKLTTKEFIQRAKKGHGDKYDYSKVNYINSRTKVCIICPEHGEFWQTPNQHLKGSGCKKCDIINRSKKLSLNQEEIIRRCKQVHGDKYDYSKVEYINLQTKVCIICPIHGEFWQTPTAHISLKEGCPKCNSKEHYNNITFIEKAHKIHGDKYDYSKVNYINAFNKICIICPEHGEFWQTAHSHLEGYGCKKCAEKERSQKYLLQQEEIIRRCKQVHGDKYDYSKVEYKGHKYKICIICPEHGEFWQSVLAHVTLKHGCPKCRQSKLELLIQNILEEKNINYMVQYTNKWLKNNNTNYNLHLDFYLPDYNIAIECQGEQHFKMVEHFGGEEGFIKRKERDAIKFEKCKEHNINLLYLVPLQYRKNEIYKNFYKDKNILSIEKCAEEIEYYVNNITRHNKRVNSSI